MPTEIRMPPLSAGAEDAKLLSWLRKEGDSVRKGEEIAEVETDKATMAIEAPHDGTLGSILVPAGVPAVRIDSPIAILLQDGESASSSVPITAEEPAVAKSATIARCEVSGSISPASSEPRSRTPASPLARRLAKDRHLDIAALPGTGPHGRIVRADVERTTQTDRSVLVAQTSRMPQQASTAPPTPAPEHPDAILQHFAGRSFKKIPLDGMRRTVAERLTRSKQTVPHYYLRRDIRVDTLFDLRAQLNKGLAVTGMKLSVNDFFIKACALALQQVPDCNAIWAADRILQLEASDIAVAVSVDGGLYTPVLRDAHSKSMSTLSREMRQLAERARERKLQLAECQGGSMTISNLGMHGIESFDAIINPPQSAILAVGAAMRKMIFDEATDAFVGARVISVTLSLDHRVLDGAIGAVLLAAIARNIENPLAMIA